jgi:hypothetical protein
VTEHKFKIGQLVYFHPKVRPQLDVVPGPYLITRRLPAAEDGECQYEIRNPSKSTIGSQERAS